MNYLLDTNTISELYKSNCDKNVKSLMDSINWKYVYISAITVGELCYGIERLPNSKKKHELSIWLYSQLPISFNNRIITLDSDVFIEWGRLRARTKRTLPFYDSIIAAIALTHNLTLVTRNTKDYEDIDNLNLINPWDFSISN